MKEVVSFLKWKWNKFETWQKWYIVLAFTFGAGIGAPKPYGNYVVAIPIIAFFFWTGKWWIWDPMVASWQVYKKEKEQLFDTIKDSHK